MNKLIDNKSIDSMRRIINCAVVFSLFLIILSTCPVGAATYYVKNGGNDSLKGLSDSTAWATIAKVRATVRSGDTVYFRSQDTWTGASPVLTLTSGVTYDGSTYGSGTRATLIASSGTSSTGVVAGPASSVVIRGLNISTDSVVTNGIDLGSYGSSSYSYVTIDNCVVHDVGARGIYIGTIGGSYYTVSNITVKNSTVYNTGWGGIVIYPTWQRAGHKVDTVLVQNCTVHTTGATENGEGIYIKDDADNVTVEFCNLYNNLHGVHLETETYETIGTPDNVVIRYNVIHDNKSAGLDTYNRGRIITASIYGNIFYDNGKTPTPRGANIMINRTAHATSTYNIYNNTIYIGAGSTSGSSHHALLLGDGQADLGTGCKGTPTINFYNNIVYSNKANAVPIRDVDSKLTGHGYNLIYNAISATSPHVNIGTKTYDRNGGALDLKGHWEATAQSTAPAFTGGTLPTGFTGTYGTNMVPNTTYFALGAASPAINAGATLGSSYNGCINGAGRANPFTRPQGAAYDIGAYEYVESGGVVTPPVVTPPVDTPPAAPKNLRVVE